MSLSVYLFFLPDIKFMFLFYYYLPYFLLQVSDYWSYWEILRRWKWNLLHKVNLKNWHTQVKWENKIVLYQDQNYDYVTDWESETRQM